MKSMTYAQKADLVAKLKRVFESVKRSNQVAMADKYRALAIKAIGDYELCSNAQRAFDAMKHRISTKPRYRYDNRAGEWVECKARNKYNASLNDCEVRERVSRMEECARLEMARARQDCMNNAFSPTNTFNGIADAFSLKMGVGRYSGQPFHIPRDYI